MAMARAMAMARDEGEGGNHLLRFADIRCHLLSPAWKFAWTPCTFFPLSHLQILLTIHCIKIEQSVCCQLADNCCHLLARNIRPQRETMSLENGNSAIIPPVIVHQSKHPHVQTLRFKTDGVPGGAGRDSRP